MKRREEPRPPEEMNGTRCGNALMSNCRAQHCPNRLMDILAFPFCEECRSMLPPLMLRRLSEEWDRIPMLEHAAEETRRVKGRRSGQWLDVATGRNVTYSVWDEKGLIANRRRIEITAAWTLRRIRRVTSRPFSPGTEQGGVE
jgi:hypothetical protein